MIKFNAISFFQQLAMSNRLAKNNKFLPCTCSGIGFLQEVIDNFSDYNNFIAVDDTFDGQIFSNSGGWNNSESYTVFILAKYEYNDMHDRTEKLNMCREIYRQFLSRLIVLKSTYDKNVTYLDLDNIRYRELGQYFMSGLTGLYFMVANVEPTELIYNAKEWAQ
jgi:hypothetical protein